MQSPEIQKIKDFLKAKRFRFATDIHIQPRSNAVLISVPESVLGEKVTSKTTSHKKLSFLKQQFSKDLGLVVDFILTRGTIHNKIEAGLNALLCSQFSNVVKEAFLSYRKDGSYDVWLEPGDPALQSETVVEMIRPVAAKYLKLFEANLAKMSFTTDESSLPSLAKILRQVKKLSPVSAEHLLKAFQSEGMKVPSSWLDRRLDTLRKRNLLVRSESGNYALTELGLGTVPHGKNRSSSDIERALALGKRKW